MHPHRLPLAAILLALAVWPGRSCRAAEADSLAAQRAALYADYRQKLAVLADWGKEKKLADEARQLKAWLPVRSPDKTYLFLLDAVRYAKPAPALQGDNLRELRARWQALRAEQAQKLFELAQRAAAEHQPTAAIELATEAAREDLDFKPAWRVLGYLKHAGAWRTPFEIKQLGEDRVWHERFGWILQSHVARYEEGQRFYRNRWMPAVEEARRRANIRDGWQVETDHYLVTTNHSLEEGVRLAGQLEQLYAVWQQVFAGYVTSDAEFARRLAKGEPSRQRDAQKHKVVYYRSRDEYIEALRPAQPQIAMTLGIYFDTARTAYFFADEDQEPSTLFHEATHQLFQETRSVVKDVGEGDNFWIIEAVACYMESLQIRNGYATLGGADEGRLPAARHRLLKDNFYCPLAELVALGKQDLQHHTDIARLYSESAGLATFLLSRHGAATVQYLESVYTGNADRDTLARLTGCSYSELDAGYRAFLQGETGRPGAQPGKAD